MARLVCCASLLLLLLTGTTSQEISFPTGSSVAEEEGSITVCVEFPSAGLSASLSAQATGTASPDDYGVVENVLVTSESPCINITIEMDDVIEPDETFIMAVVLSGSVLTAPVTITDSNELVVSLTEARFTAQEEELDSMVMVCAAIINGTIMGGKLIKAELVLQGDTATAGNDFEVSGLDAFEFSNSSNESCVAVTILVDRFVEATEQFTAVIVPDTPDNTQVINNTATVSILDNDMATVSLQNTELTIVEGNFSNVTFVEICAVLVNVAAGLQRSVEINFTSTSDTATEGVDFERVSELLVFESGAGVAAVQCLNVTIIGDNIIEGGVSESFSVEAVARPPDVIQGTTTVNITIQGDGDENLCVILLEPANGALDVSGYDIGDTATYNCTEGFTLVGEAVLTCQLAGEWSAPLPMCFAMCESLDIRNGFVAFTDGLQLAGDTANYGCIPGFTLVGNTNRVCRENGTWTGSDPSCEMTVVVCPNLDDPDNGQVDHVSSPLVGAVAAYSCDELFCLIGGESRTCTAEGAWSGEEPICDGAVSLQYSGFVLLLVCAVAAVLSQFAL